MAPVYARGKATRRAATTAARRWQRLSYRDVVASMKGVVMGAVTLPIAFAHPNGGAATPLPSPSLCPSPSLTLKVSSNHHALQERLHANAGCFWHAEGAAHSEGGVERHCESKESTRNADSIDAEEHGRHMFTSSVAASRDITLHVGAPRKLGYPQSVEFEKANWAEAVYRGEAYAYHHYDPSTGGIIHLSHSGGNAPAPDLSVTGTKHVAAPSPVRWLTQPMRDGFVACRVDAHSGVTTRAMLEAREAARYFGKHLPPFDVSPYYGASELLDRWCLFGEEEQLTGGGSSMSTSGMVANDSHDHVARVLSLAMGSALLSGGSGAWLNGAVVVHRETGDAALILGPPGSGKTTLALHCLAAMSEVLTLVASEHFFLCDGAQHFSANISRNRHLVASVPAPVGVGIGAILGTLRPNPLLTSRLTAVPPVLSSPDAVAQLLRNSDGVIWAMTQKYPIRLMSPCTKHPPLLTPAALLSVRGVVLLDWDLAELHARSSVRVSAAATRISLENGGWARHVEPLVDTWAAVRDHYLLRSLYNAADAPRELAAALASGRRTAHGAGTASTAVRLAGSVDFDLGVHVIKKLLGV